ncbi:MAG: type II secretion system F family protein [Bdellovibrionota bacterium]|jgi:tight adherence protein B
MDTNVIILIGVVCILGLIMLGLLMIGNPFAGAPSTKGQISRIVAAQRASGVPDNRKAPTEKTLLDSAQEVSATVNSSSKLTVQKKLRYAQWKMPPLMFYLLQFLISATVAALVSIKFGWFIVVLSFSSGPIFMHWLVNRFMNKRVKDFDIDYAPFLLSLVSMLKTGMNAMTAMEAAANGLEPDSLVREEVELMLERLRFGVPEERSIGTFGEDINHPEIELFVQALMLSRRVGGALSDTLERLSHQVRKRQYFRDSANAAVGMQRGSVWIIIAVIFFIEGYMYVVNPEMVEKSIENETGWMMWQIALVVILFGMYWIRQVTKIRI